MEKTIYICDTCQEEITKKRYQIDVAEFDHEDFCSKKCLYKRMNEFIKDVNEETSSTWSVTASTGDD